MSTEIGRRSVSAPKIARKTEPAASSEPGQDLDLGRLKSLMGYALRRAQRVVFENFAKDFSALGLRPAQFSALVVIQRNPGRKQSEIAAALGIQRTNFVSMMDELERRGLTYRGKSQADRRAHAISLTEKGEKVLKKAMVAIEVHERRWVDLLGPKDHACLLKTLRMFLDVGAGADEAG